MSRRFVKVMMSCWLVILAVIGPTLVCHSQSEPPESSEVKTPRPAFDESTLVGCELHVVGAYSPKEISDNRVFVEVKPTEKPIVLVMASDERVEWCLKIDPKSKVRQIIAIGNKQVAIGDPQPNLPIAILYSLHNDTTATRAMREQLQEDLQFHMKSFAWHTWEGEHFRRRLKSLTGLDVTTIQGSHKATRFVVDGVVGRDVADPKQTEESPRQGSTSLTVPKATTEARLTLEAARCGFETQYTRGEGQVQQFALEYRVEFGRESPNTKKLRELKQALEAAVSTSFKNQVMLQKTRLQIAELDLAELQAKSARRESLAGKIVERRVSDLISGEDMGWATSKKATRPDTSAETVASQSLPGKQHEPAARNPIKSEEPSIRQTDPDLDGEWKLVELKGDHAFFKKKDHRLRISATEFSVLAGADDIRCEIGLDPKVTPHLINVTARRGTDVKDSGIYKVEGDKLTIAWQSKDPFEPQLDDFSGKSGAVATYERIKPIPNFATPQELLDYLARANGEGDVTKGLRTFLELIDKDEVNRFAGVCLRTASVLRSVSKVAEGFSALAPDGENDEIIRVGRGMDTLIKKGRLSKPPRAAQAAYAEISASDFGFLQLMMSSRSDESQTPVVDADVYSAKLRKAAAVLKDPAQFIVDFTTLMTELEDSQEDEPSTETAAKKLVDWQITVEGDKAIVIDRNATGSTSRLPHSPVRMELINVGKTWRISNMIPDEAIIELQQGPKRSTSSDSDKPDARTTPPSRTENRKNGKTEPELEVPREEEK